MTREYVLGIGSEDRLRLDILNEIYGFQSRDFVTNVVVKKFSPRSVIEIGCGHGQILCFWGKQLESSGGKITGIDLFEDQVALTLERVKLNGLDNVTVKVADINLIAPPTEEFDCAYSRFVLMHQKNRGSFVSNLAKLLCHKGVSVFEEPCLSSQFCHPYFPEFYLANELTIELGRKKGINYDGGALLLDDVSTFFEIREVRISQPVLQTPQHKSIVAYSFKQISPELVRYGIIDADEANRIAERLFEFSRCSMTVAGALKIFQVAATLK